MIAWHDAWHEALYGVGGFYRREQPADHFRTSVNASDAFATALLTHARRRGLRTVVDVGAGSGELLLALEGLAPGELDLHGVDVRPRPGNLPDVIAWSTDLPDRIDGLLIANELLDNIPTDVVERDEDGVLRLVLVDPASGAEQLGQPVTDPETLAWLRRWWPCAEPGERAEVGLARESWWREAVSRVVHGSAIAIDYGHRGDGRPPFGSLRAYRDGAEVDVVPDGSRDVTAHVAVDALAEAVGATVTRQREVLRDLGVDGTRPPLALASTDPRAYLSALAAASEAAELTAVGGLGDFWWVVSSTG